MNKIIVVAMVVAGLTMGGCLAPAFYADISGNNYAQPGAVTSAGGKVLTGKACWNSYVGVVALGDASVAAALKDAGVDTTKPVKNMVVDHTVYAIGPFYGEYCTVVTVTVEGGASAAAPTAKPAGDESKTADNGKASDDSFDWSSD